MNTNNQEIDEQKIASENIQDTEDRIKHNVKIFFASSLLILAVAGSIFAANLATGDFNELGVALKNWLVILILVGSVFACFILSWSVLMPIFPKWTSRQAKSWLAIEIKLRQHVDQLETENTELRNGIKENGELIRVLKESATLLQAQNKTVFYSKSAGKALEPFFLDLSNKDSPIKKIWIQATFMGVNKDTFNLLNHFKNLIDKWCENTANKDIFSTVYLILPQMPESVRNARLFAAEILGHVANKCLTRSFVNTPEIRLIFLPYKDVFPCVQLWGQEGMLVVPSVHSNDTSRDRVDTTLPVAFGGVINELDGTYTRLRSYLEEISEPNNGCEVESWKLPRLDGDRSSIRMTCSNYVLEKQSELDERLQLGSSELEKDYPSVKFKLKTGGEGCSVSVQLVKDKVFQPNFVRLFQDF